MEDLSPKTARNYEGCYRRHIESSVGEDPATTTGVFEIEAYSRSMADSGLGLPTLKHICVVFLKGTKLANKWAGGIIPSSVALADLPKNAARSEPVRTPSIEEARAIIQKVEQRYPSGCNHKGDSCNWIVKRRGGSDAVV